MARIYADENFPLPAVEALRELGHDVLTAYESGKANQTISDENLLAFAVSEGRILVTLNRKHFIRLHSEKPDHAGLAVCTVDPNFKALANRIHAALQAQTEAAKQLIRINRPQK